MKCFSVYVVQDDAHTRDDGWVLLAPSEDGVLENAVLCFLCANHDVRKVLIRPSLATGGLSKPMVELVVLSVLVVLPMMWVVLPVPLLVVPLVHHPPLFLSGDQEKSTI